MGLTWSSTQPEAPPKVVLVPPMFDRDLKGRSRFTKSSYDYQATKKRLKWLFQDYLGYDRTARFFVAPINSEPAFTVKAKVGTKKASMCLRYEPFHDAHTFVDLKASPQEPGDAMLRICALNLQSGLGWFATFPLAPQIASKPPQIGVRYSSPSFTAGALLAPYQKELTTAWVAGRYSGLTLAAQVHPKLHLPTAKENLRQQLSTAASSLLSAAPPTQKATSRATTPEITTPASTTTASAASVGPVDGSTPDALTAASTAASTGASTADSAFKGSPAGDIETGRIEPLPWTQQLVEQGSFMIAYTPPPDPDGVPGSARNFTAALEVVENRLLYLSFYQHIALARKVMNPFEDENVVGITNYLDLGISLSTPLTKQPHPDAMGVQVGAAWQVNKNWMVKGRVGPDTSCAVSLAFKSWLVPSLTFAASAIHNIRDPLSKAKFGVYVQLENFGSLRYEKNTEVAAGQALLQRHEATDMDLSHLVGGRTLVLKTTAGKDYNVPEPASARYM